MRFVAFDVRHKPEAAGIVFLRRMVEPLRSRRGVKIFDRVHIASIGYTSTAGTIGVFSSSIAGLSYINQTELIDVIVSILLMV